MSSTGTSAVPASSASASSTKRMIKDIVATKKIGSGSFATVYQGYNQHTGVIVAVKSINKEKLKVHKKHEENLDSEVKVMQKLVHPNIVRLIDIHRTDRHVYLIMEYCDSNDLSHLIKQNGPMSAEIARPLFRQLCAGLQFMRAHNMIHRDLKPQNLLLSSGQSKLYSGAGFTPSAAAAAAASATAAAANDTKQATAAATMGADDLSLNPDGSSIKPPLLKIADFGFARYIGPQSLAATLCGSPLYMAPEILRYQKYDASADLWSVGAILYEMCCGRPPYNGTNHIELLSNIEKREVVFPPFPVTVRKAAAINIPGKPAAATSAASAQSVPVPALHPDCVDLLKGLLKRNPRERMSFAALFSHPFVTGSGSGASKPAATPAVGTGTANAQPARSPLPAQSNSPATPAVGTTTLQQTTVMDRTVVALPPTTTPATQPAPVVTNTRPAPSPSPPAESIPPIDTTTAAAIAAAIAPVNTPLSPSSAVAITGVTAEPFTTPFVDPPTSASVSSAAAIAAAANAAGRPLSRASQHLQNSQRTVPPQPLRQPVPNPATRSTISVVDDDDRDSEAAAAAATTAAATAAGATLDRKQTPAPTTLPAVALQQPTPMMYATQPQSPLADSPSPPLADGAAQATGAGTATRTAGRLTGSSHDNGFVLVSGTQSGSQPQHQLPVLLQAVEPTPAASPTAVPPPTAPASTTGFAFASSGEALDCFYADMERAQLVAECADERQKQLAKHTTAASLHVSQLLNRSVLSGAGSSAGGMSVEAVLSAFAGTVVLYIRVLELLMTGMQNMKLFKVKQPVPFDDTTARTIDKYVHDSSQRFAQTLNKLQSAQNKLTETYNATAAATPGTAAAAPAPNALPPIDQLPSPTVEEMLADWARQRTIDTAIDESSASPAESLAKHSSVAAVFECLLRGRTVSALAAAASTAAGGDDKSSDTPAAVDDHDRRSLTRDIELVQMRMDVIRRVVQQQQQSAAPAQPRATKHVIGFSVPSRS